MSSNLSFGQLTPSYYGLKKLSPKNLSLTPSPSSDSISRGRAYKILTAMDKDRDGAVTAAEIDGFFAQNPNSSGLNVQERAVFGQLYFALQNNRLGAISQDGKLNYRADFIDPGFPPPATEFDLLTVADGDRNTLSLQDIANFPTAFNFIF